MTPISEFHREAEKARRTGQAGCVSATALHLPTQLPGTGPVFWLLKKWPSPYLGSKPHS
jgi:hypothetical protein